MNDRVSAVPPADFLGPDAMDADEYEKQFALDWKPPDFQLEDTTHGSNSNNNNNSNNSNSRTSFVSMRSGIASSSLTRIGTGASGSVWSKAPKQHGSLSSASSAGTTAGGGFFSRVGGKLGLRRSKSSMGVGEEDEEEEEEVEEGIGSGGGSISNNNNGGLGHFIPPVFKHKRSESVNSGAAAIFKREAEARPGFLKRSTTGLPSSSSTSSAAAAAVASPAGPLLPGFDPTRRPTRDEITANYQSLLASGFFGTHAIQSTRFSAPGQQRSHQQPAGAPGLASFAQRVAEDEDEQVQDRSLPPSPERQPPPPPPNRLAPPPPSPPLSMAMDTDSSASDPSEAIPVSPTVLFHPTQSQQPPSPERMPPPPPKLPQSSKPDHKANLSFSAVPYSSTRPGIEPSIVDHPYRTPPVSLARFSLESGRRSYDVQQQRPQRGIKRPFTIASNGSQASFATTNSFSDGSKGSGEHYRGNQYCNDNTFTAGIAEEDKPESGARKLVKKLRKSASKISIDLGRNAMRQTSISRMAPPDVDNQRQDDNDDNNNMMVMSDCQDNHATNNLAPSARTSMSSTVRRSFSWKFARMGAGSKNTTTEKATDKILNKTDVNRTPLASHAPSSLLPPTTITPTNPFSNFSFLTGSGNGDGNTPPGNNNEASQNRLKKREFRGRRLRKPGSPLKQSPLVDLPQPSSPTKDTSMDWQQQAQQSPTTSSPKRLRKANRSGSESRSRSRSRSNVIRVLHHHPGTMQQNTADGGTPATITTSTTRPFFASYNSSHSSVHRVNTTTTTTNNHNDESDDASADGMMMEGVEFSFHFPGRTRPTSTASSTTTTTTINGTGIGGGVGGGPLAVVPDTNRGVVFLPANYGHAGVQGGGAGTVMTTTAIKSGGVPHSSGWGGEDYKEDMIF